MILQALVRHYEDLVKRGEAQRPGWSPAKVAFALRLREDGTLSQVVSLKSERQMGQKTVLAPRELAVPAQEKRASGIRANFLCDNAGYLLGVDNKGNPKRTLACFQAAKELHLRLLDGVEAPAASAVRAFFSGWDPTAAETHPALSEYLDELKKGANLVFQVGLDQFVQEDPAIQTAWQRHYDQGGTGEPAVCLVTGEKNVPATLHPAIKGVPGAQSSGASLVSFNAPSLESYDHEQGGNAPTGEYAAFAYGAALNHLLADYAHRQVIGDTTVVFWAEGGEPAYQDAIMAALTGKPQQTVSDTDLKDLFRTLADGRPYPIHNIVLHPNTHFCILGLSPNAARLSVRFFWQDTFGGLLKNINRHYEQLEIVRPSCDHREQLSLWDLLQETVNQKSTNKEPSHQLTGDVLRSILTGAPYPATLLNAVQLRIRADRQITRGRAAILKAYYLRNPHSDCPKEVLAVKLDPQNAPENVPYTLGRLFSVLEAIQQSANPSINATIKDKYFSSASATPATIFPILLNLSQKHLRKLEKGLAIYYDRQIGELVKTLGTILPAHLSLPEQGSFQLGYYQQTQIRYSSDKKEEN